jgi:hypothetical protein
MRQAGYLGECQQNAWTGVRKRTGEPVGISVREGVSDNDMCHDVFRFRKSECGTREHETREHQQEVIGGHGIAG